MEKTPQPTVSQDMTDDAAWIEKPIDQLLKEAGEPSFPTFLTLNQPLPKKVMLQDIESRIQTEFYLTGEAALNAASQVLNRAPESTLGDDLSRLTVCVVLMKNGFASVGVNACVSKETWDAELGRRYAREKALEPLWEIFGYQLRAAQYEVNACINRRQHQRTDQAETPRQGDLL